MYKPGIPIQPLHKWLEISAAQYLWKQTAFPAFNFLIIPRCNKDKDQPMCFRWAVITDCLMLWRSFFQKQRMCMFCYLFFWTFLKYSLQQKPVRAISMTSQTHIFRIFCCPAALMVQHPTRLWAHLYSSHSRAWHNLGYTCSLELESRANCLGTTPWNPVLRWFSAALCQQEQLFPIPMALVLSAPHLVLDALHGGPAERGDVHSHGLPVLTQHTQLELYCLPLLQTVTFVCHANNSKGIDLPFHLT